MKISAFPKCFMDDICVHHTMTLLGWIEMATTLGAEGLEMYHGFFHTFDPAYLDEVGNALAARGFAMPMFCCSPDFTNPDKSSRQHEIDRQAKLIGVARHLGGARTVCRVLTGQRYPEISREQGLEWVLEAFNTLLPVAREHDIVLGMENHYKDTYWIYPEFAQKREDYLTVLNAMTDRENFGVQFDPSNAIFAGDDPVELLRLVADRVVSMHASDRYLIDGATIEDLRRVENGEGYATFLKHGVTGKGTNDYDAICQILADSGYKGWISIEDGMNGMDEMRQSIDFLKLMRAKYFSEAS